MLNNLFYLGSLGPIPKECQGHRKKNFEYSHFPTSNKCIYCIVGDLTEALCVILTV